MRIMFRKRYTALKLTNVKSQKEFESFLAKHISILCKIDLQKELKLNKLKTLNYKHIEKSYSKNKTTEFCLCSDDGKYSLLIFSDKHTFFR